MDRSPWAGLPALLGLDREARACVLRQDAVVTVAQAASWGLGHSLVSGRVAAGEWQQLLPGGRRLHPGLLTWRQRARAGLLYRGTGSALSDRSEAFLHGVVTDPGPVADGIESPLELRYRRDVERAHGLPDAEAQVRERVDGRWIRADRVYRGLGVRVEPDDQLGHPYASTDADVWRDNAVRLTSGDLTLRYRWPHVAADPCRTARQVVRALRQHGWTGTPRPCTTTGCCLGR